jgi:uncharacterized protein YjbI with pentapeptide repeats
MKKITISAPQLPALLDDCDASSFGDDASLEACRAKSVVFAGSAKALNFDEVVLERPVLVGARIEKMTARDLIIRGGDLSACRAWESSLLRSTLHDCRMTGWDINRGICKDVLFEDCKLDMANFRFVKLTRVTFRRCILTEADFLQAQLHDVQFERCHIERAEFGQATFKNVDFRSSELINIHGWQYCKGVTIDHTQLLSAAPYLAQEIGIIVE